MPVREVIAFSSLALGILLTANYFDAFSKRRLLSAMPPEPLATQSTPVSTPPQIATSNDIVALGLPDQRAIAYAATTEPSDPWPATEVSLIEAIQRELHRLGCYSGAIHGRWTPAVAAAAKDLTERLNSVLPTWEADHAHLALARSQSEPVCTSRGVSDSGSQPAAMNLQTISPELAPNYRMSLGALSASPRKTSRKGRSTRPNRKRGGVQQRFLHPLGTQ